MNGITALLRIKTLNKKDKKSMKGNATNTLKYAKKLADNLDNMGLCDAATELRNSFDKLNMLIKIL